MFTVIYGVDTVVAKFDNLGDATTELMKLGRGYAIWDGEDETTYEELMLDA